MLTNGPIKPAYVVLAIAVIAFAVGVGIDAGQLHLCGPADDNCLREWIGALSGWIAGIAALATGGILLGQLRLMRSQTEHVIGTADPHASLQIRSGTTSNGLWIRATLIVTNVNRAPIRIKSVKLTAQGYNASTSLESVNDSDNTSVNYGTSLNQMPELRVAGWTDRAVGPELAKLSLKVDLFDRSKPVTSLARSLRFCCSVKLEVLETRPRPKSLVAIDTTPLP